MSIGFSSAILASVVSLTVAIAILFREPRQRVYICFSAFTFALFLWHAASFISRLVPLQQMQILAALFIPPTAFLLFREMLRTGGDTLSRMVWASIVVSALFFPIALSPWGDHPALLIAVVLYLAASNFWVGRTLWVRIRRAPTESDRKRLRYFLYGGVLASILATFELWPSSAMMATLGHLAVIFYVYFLYQSIIAQRLVDLVELLGKAAVLGMLSFVLAAVYALLVLWVGADQQGLWLFNTLVASTVILIVYDQAKPWVEKTTAKLIFRDRYHLLDTIPSLLRSLRAVIRVEDMRDRVLDALHAEQHSTHVAMYLAMGEGQVTYTLLGSRGHPFPERMSLGDYPTLLRELQREERPILLEQLQLRHQEHPTLVADPATQRELERNSEAINAMHDIGTNAIIPMVAEDRLVGFLALGSGQKLDTYTAAELTALLSLAEACAIVIENSQEFEKRRERDRLAAIGEMAAGMAHEIRNPLGAIKGAAQCMDPDKMPEDSREFLDVIIEEVDRLGGVVRQFLEYARPYSGDPQPTDINGVVAATTRLITRDAIPRNVELIQDLAHGLPRVSVDAEQLKQVLINLVLNAVHAMPDGGNISIQTRIAHDQSTDFDPDGEDQRPHRASVLVKVTDTGEGISAEDLERIFVPFFTTKSHGTGLGLAISQRIVENCGGHIDVASTVGKGTTFIIRLPATRAEVSRLESVDPTPARPPPDSEEAVAADAPSDAIEAV